MVNPEAGSAAAMTAAYRHHIETCRRMADAMLDATARLEQIGLQFARSAVHDSLDAASTGQPKPAAPDLESMMSAQREVAETMSSASREIFRLMSEYGAGLTQSFGASMYGGGMPQGVGIDSMMKSWNETMQRFGSMMQAGGPKA